MEQVSKEVLALIDADFLLYTATMGNKVFDEEGNPVRKDNRFVYTDKTLQEVTDLADIIINTVLDKCQASKYIGYLGNSKCFRYDDYPEYKGKRKVDKPLWFNELKEYLNKEWKFELLNNGLEADDAVNIARNLLKKDYNIFIISTDKDLIKCIPGKYINAKDCTIVRTSKTQAEIAFWGSMITGDAADNIPGLKNKGKKFVESIFKDPIISYENLVINAYKVDLLENWEKEYNKMFKLLYILDEFEGFEVNIIERDYGRRDSISSTSCEEDLKSFF